MSLKNKLMLVLMKSNKNKIQLKLSELLGSINESSSATYVLGFFIIAFLHNMWRMPHLPLVWNQGAGG
ncbi:hypothetical protein HYD49_03855 [Mycoplasmopsis bovis]|nr:hypothetical protein HYD49_03855 [Mycoplasmopsis bovis]